MSSQVKSGQDFRVRPDGVQLRFIGASRRARALKSKKFVLVVRMSSDLDRFCPLDMDQPVIHKYIDGTPHVTRLYSSPSDDRGVTDDGRETISYSN